MKFNLKRFLFITILTFAIGGVFALLTKSGMDSYMKLDKPIEVPKIVFPIVWSILYLLMSISYYMISSNDINNNASQKIIYWVQLVFNSLWTLIFFGIKNYLFAFIWLLILLVLIVVMIVKFYKLNKKAGLIQIPYLLWVVFAGYLNLGIYLLNR